MTRHVLEIDDLSAEDVTFVLDLAEHEHRPPIRGLLRLLVEGSR